VGVAESDSDDKTNRGLSDSDVNRSRLGRPLQRRPKRPGSRLRRHGVLRACEPRGTDPELTRMARSACALTASEPDGELTWGTDLIDAQPKRTDGLCATSARARWASPG
jgi:hypothetical protein